MTNSPEKRHKPDNHEQSRRFEEKARELGSDESGKKFERAFKKVVPTAKKKKST
jgi:hypothetical protein